MKINLLKFRSSDSCVRAASRCQLRSGVASKPVLARSRLQHRRPSVADGDWTMAITPKVGRMHPPFSRTQHRRKMENSYGNGPQTLGDGVAHFEIGAAQ